MTMKKLGEILLDKGTASVGELHTALEACHRHRSRLGTQLLRLGFVTEKQLLEALAEQTGRPPVPREILDAATLDVMSLLPLKIARRLRAVPFARLNQYLHVALINPRDDAAIEEIHVVTGLDIEPFVVTEATLEAAVARMGAGDIQANGANGRSENPDASVADWENLWNGVLPTVDDLMVLPPQAEDERDPGVMYVTYPGLAPVVDPSAVIMPGFLDETGLKKALCAAESRDGVGEALLSYAARFLTRICLFSVYKDKAHGWLVEGMGPVLEDVQSFSIDLSLPSIMSTVAASGRPHSGPIPPGELNASAVACLGDPLSHDMLLVPVRVQDRMVAFLMGDIPGQSTIGVPVSDLAEAANVTGMALEMIILRRKIGRALGA